jgi:hypothetical protein
MCFGQGSVGGFTEQSAADDGKFKDLDEEEATDEEDEEAAEEEAEEKAEEEDAADAATADAESLIPRGRRKDVT